MYKAGRFRKPYGALLVDGLETRGVPIQGSILEIGGGLGDLADGFMQSLQHNGYTWTFADVSPLLLERQGGKRYPIEVRTIAADAHELSNFVEPESIDLLIANEVIGDLDTADCITQEDLQGVGSIEGPQRRNLRKDYGRMGLAFLKYELDTDNAPPTGAALNVGAVQLIEELTKVLKQGGYAFISENDCELLGEFPWPRQIKLPGHIEYSVKFSHLAKVARKLGFEVEYGNLADFLGYPSVPFIREQSYVNFASKHTIPIRGPEFDRLISLTREYSITVELPPKTEEQLIRAVTAFRFTPELVKRFFRVRDDEFPYLLPLEDHQDQVRQYSYLLLKKPALR